MSFGKKPTVFVSSTCYDLQQIRTDIRNFLGDQLGYDVLLSEYNSFPLDPNLNTVDNCLRAVNERADIFVLIIGCRYGSTTETGYSVTNLEYINAKAKNIPIYVFVDKKILNSIHIWKDNPTGNYKSIVDTPALFDFVDEVRSRDSYWTYGFETAQDIISTLKNQLSYLLSDCLALKQKTAAKIVSPAIRKLEGEALQIVLLKPDLWEYRLFAQVLSDEIMLYTDRKRDVKYGFCFSHHQKLNSAVEVTELLIEKGAYINCIVDMISTLYNRTIVDAMGPDGKPGDPDAIIYSAKRLAEFYKTIIDICLDMRATIVEDEYTALVLSFVKLFDITLCDIENYSARILTEISSIPLRIQENSGMHLNFSLKLSPPDQTEFHNEINKLSQKYGFASYIPKQLN